MQYHINHANIKEWAKNYDGPLFDSILCDPPYELGFMGKSWDSSGIAFDTDMWADILKLLKPGGHLLAFSGSRTYHRMAVAIEDAGFEIRDMIEWVYGSGFPKSLNIGKALDGKIGKQGKGFKSAGDDGRKAEFKQDKSFRSDYGYIYEPTTDNAKLYEGYGTALKPAHEPCVLARKPIEGTVANNVLKHGTGGLNIDGSRVGTSEKLQGSSSGRPDIRGGNFKEYKGANPDELGYYEQNTQGRFPANLIHDGSDEVEAVFPQTKSGSGVKKKASNSADSIFNINKIDGDYLLGDSGSASRFFYTAKASKSERNAGLEGFEEVDDGVAQMTAKGGLKCLLCNRWKNSGNPCKCDNPNFEQQQWNGTKMKNHHPTVKPLSLTKYLATLIKPPTGGRLLVPFSGSGSEMIGALQAGWEYVEGVELTREYIPIAEARIKHWLDKMSKEQLEML